MHYVSKKDKWLYGLITLFTLLFVIFGEGTGTAGYVLGGDSEAYYIPFRHHIGVAPLYPFFIQIVRLICGEVLYLNVVAAVQMLFLTFAVVYLVYTIGQECGLGGLEKLIIWGASLLPFVILLPEDPIGHTIMTESITYPLVYLFVAVASKAIFKKNEKQLIGALILSVVAGLVRSQMLFLFAALGMAYAYICLSKVKEYGGLKCIMRLVSCFLVLIFSMKFVSWFTIWYEKAFFDAPNVAFSDQTLVQQMLYFSDEEDVELFEDEELKEIFKRCYKEMEIQESNYKYQETGLLAWREIIRDCGANSYLLTDVIEEYLEPQGLMAENYIEREVQIADISHRLAYPLLKVHWRDKLSEAFISMRSGFISTVLFHKERIYELIHIATLLFYLFAIGASVFCRIKDKDSKEAEYMLLVLGISIINVASCNLVFFGLQRYLAYTLGMNWIGMFMIIRKLYKNYFISELKFRKTAS